MRRTFFPLFSAVFLTGLLFTGPSGWCQQNNVPVSVKTLQKQPAAEVKNNKPKAAIALYEKALATDSLLLDAHYHLAVLYAAQQQPSKAIPHFQQVVQKGARVYKDATFKLAESLQLAHRFEQAGQLYSNVLAETKIKDYERRDLLEKRIKECFDGLELQKKPVQVTINNVGNKFNTPAAEKFPVLISKGKNIVYTSALKPDLSKPDYVSSVFSAALTSGTNINPSSSASLNRLATIVSVKPDGAEIYLVKPEDKGTLFVSAANGDNWLEPKPLPEPINSKYKETSVCISADGDYLFFASDRPEGFGGLDLYISMRQPDDTWSEAMNLGANINTEFDEDLPFIDSQNNTLYFSSRGHNSMGGYDLFRSEITDVIWTKAVNLGYPVNSASDELGFSLTPDGNAAYFSSNRSGGAGDFDIYQVIFKNPAQDTVPGTKETPLIAQAEPNLNEANTNAAENNKILLRGMVIDRKTKQPLAATVAITDNELQQEIAAIVTDSTGNYSIAVDPYKEYGIAVIAPDFLFYSENIQLKSDEPLHKEIELKKAVIGANVILRNIFFESGKSVLSKQSETELERLYKLMITSPNLRIEIAGHTDNTGSAAINQRISEERAMAVVEYLQKRGINKERLEAKGYGFTKPVADNSTEEGRSLNRRTEFSIIGITADNSDMQD